MKVRETYVPQSYAWGAQAQVDCYEAHADLGNERVNLQMFAMRSMASVRHSAAPIGTRRNGRFSKLTSAPSPTLAECFENCATTT